MNHSRALELLMSPVAAVVLDVSVPTPAGVRPAPSAPPVLTLLPDTNTGEGFGQARSERTSGAGRALAAAPAGEQVERLHQLLADAASCVDPTRQERLRNEVVTAYLPAARSVAARYRGRGVEGADLQQLAYLGLLKAVRRWQPGRCENFLQFAVPTMTGEIKRYFRDHSMTVRLPRQAQELRAVIRHAQDEHWQRHGTAPSDRDLAAAIGAGVDEVRDARAAMALCRPNSLDLPMPSGWSIAETHGDTDPSIDRVDDRMTVRQLIRELTDRERRILHLRFEQQWSQSRIAAEIGVSQMQISRYLRAITTKLAAAA